MPTCNSCWDKLVQVQLRACASKTGSLAEREDSEWDARNACAKKRTTPQILAREGEQLQKQAPKTQACKKCRTPPTTATNQKTIIHPAQHSPQANRHPSQSDQIPARPSLCIRNRDAIEAPVRPLRGDGRLDLVHRTSQPTRNRLATGSHLRNGKSRCAVCPKRGVRAFCQNEQDLFTHRLIKLTDHCMCVCVCVSACVSAKVIGNSLFAGYI